VGIGTPDRIKNAGGLNKQYKQWRIEDLPIIRIKWDFKIIRQTSQQFCGIEELTKRNNLHELIIATDCDLFL
jgi:DNA topoisomerase III